MRVNWSKRALADLNRIADYIERDNPDAAERVATRIVEQAASLSSMAQRGTPGRADGTRERVILPWPYVLIYRIVGEDVRIVHIRHTSRQWPGKNSTVQ